MDAKVTWQKGMSFTGTAESGFNISLDADRDVGGVDNGFRPLELMAISLAGCTAMDVISIMKKKQQDVTHFEVRTHADRAEDFPKVFTRATVTYVVTGRHVDETALRRSIELSVTKYCPASAMLSRIIPIDHEYEIYEDKGSGEAELVTRGTYQSQPLSQ